MTQPPSSRVLYILWKQWSDHDNELKDKKSVEGLLSEHLSYTTESFRIKKSLVELYKLKLVDKGLVATGKSGSQPAGYRIVTDGTLVVRPTTASILIELRDRRPLPVEENVFVDFVLGLGLTEDGRVLSDADIRSQLADCCASQYAKKDARSMLSPTEKLHQHFDYLRRLAAHASKKNEPAAPQAMKADIAVASQAERTAEDRDRGGVVLKFVLPRIGKDKLDVRETRDFESFVNEHIRPLPSTRFAEWFEHIGSLFPPPAADQHFKADLRSMLENLRATLKGFDR